ncbi:hypothetical protein [Gryllotalpicola sp.]|uniref:hypothetical protein n=1 Tax=Gryllotalpicola sp. TaxID=1932787 RepID=UPI0026159AEA|nr:hypothetical protein [Gryllotalpicola sp.]
MSEPRRSVTDRLAAAAPAVGRVGVLVVLVAVYAVLVMAALGRSIFQIVDHFGKAPAAITISAGSAVVYIVAMVALIIHRGVWYRVAWVTVCVEFAGVLIVGFITTLSPDALGTGSGNAFGDTSTVWTVFGQGYWFVPAVLPLAGMWWLRRHPVRAVAR